MKDIDKQLAMIQIYASVIASLGSVVLATGLALLIFSLALSYQLFSVPEELIDFVQASVGRVFNMGLVLSSIGFIIIVSTLIISKKEISKA